MTQTLCGVIRRQYDGSSKDQVVIATWKDLSVKFHLPENLGDLNQLSQ
jgi:hypothetical protein